VNSLDELIARSTTPAAGWGLFTPEKDEDHPVLEIFDEDEQED